MIYLLDIICMVQREISKSFSYTSFTHEKSPSFYCKQLLSTKHTVHICTSHLAVRESQTVTIRTPQSGNVSKVLQNGDDKVKQWKLLSFWTLMVHSFAEMQYYNCSQEMED